MARFDTHSRRALAIVGLALLAIMLLVPTASAFEGRGGQVVVIGSDEVIDDDLYVGASNFTLDGRVKGDLFVGGSTIVINGVVEGDLFAAGQSVTINGTVEDDVRIGGWALTVDGEIGDDLLASGFSLETKPESKVGGDLLVGGYQARLAGDVAGDARVNANAVTVEGRIGGDLAVDVDGAQQGQRMPAGFPFAPNMPPVPPVPSGLAVSGSASIGGNLDYTAATQVPIPSGVVAGQTSFTQYIAPQVEQKPQPTLTDRAVGWVGRQVQRLITFLLIGAVMMWLVPAWTHATAHVVRKQPLPSLGWGAVALASFVVAMTLIAIVTVIVFVIFRVLTLRELARLLGMSGALGMAVAAYAFGIVWRYVARIIIAVLLGQLVFVLFRSKAAGHRWWPMLLGVFLYVAITSIPVLGWLLGLVAALFGLGAIWIWTRDWWRSRRTPGQVVAAGPPEAPPAEASEPGEAVATEAPPEAAGGVMEAKGPAEPPEGTSDVPPPSDAGPGSPG